MTNRPRSLYRAISAGALGVALFSWLLLASLNGMFAAFAVLALIGGAATAGVLFTVHAWRPGSGPVGDVLAPGAPPTAIINMTSVPVAGIGGLGFVIVALIVALQFPLTTFALIAGVAGGVTGALFVILRRRDRALPSSSQGPSARVFLREGRDDGPHQDGPPAPGAVLSGLPRALAA